MEDLQLEAVTDRRSRFGAGYIMAVLMVATLTSLADTPHEGQSLDDSILHELKTIANPLSPSDPVYAAAEKVAKQGEAVIPIVMRELAKPTDESNFYFRRMLVEVLWRIPGAKAARGMLELVLYHRQSDNIFNVCARRSLASREIRCDISNDELQEIIRRVTLGLGEGDDMCLILSQCKNLAPEIRLAPILDATESRARLMEQAPSDEHDPPRYAVASSIEVLLNAVRNVGEVGIPHIRKRYQEAGSEQIKKWFLLGLGMASEHEVGPQIRDIVEHDPDVYTRGIAVHAYASSVGEKAISLIETMVNDSTVARYMPNHGRPGNPVADAARNELARLRAQKKQR